MAAPASLGHHEVMALTWCTDLSPAAWMTDSPIPWDRLVTFGPAGFPTYARLRFIGDPQHAGQRENDIALSPDHPTDTSVMRRLVARLGRHSTTPHDLYAAYWDGWGAEAFPRAAATAPLFHVPNRSFYLARATAADLGPDGLTTWPGHPDIDQPIPALVWPADQAWCVARDVDPHWAGIGAARPVVDELIATPDLDVVPADPGAPQPSYA